MIMTRFKLQSNPVSSNSHKTVIVFNRSSFISSHAGDLKSPKIEKPKIADHTCGSAFGTYTIPIVRVHVPYPARCAPFMQPSTGPA